MLNLIAILTIGMMTAFNILVASDVYKNILKPWSETLIIENFEDGEVTLRSYSIEEDQDPNDWEVTNEQAYKSVYSLKLYGNTWKAQDIMPRLLEQNTVWQIAIFIQSIGEMQSFGLSDGINELFYTFRGTEVLVEPEWRIVYQGIAPIGEWQTFLLPVGEDWYNTFGYRPNIVSLYYINDNDSPFSHGVVYFDEVFDITAIQPIEPSVSIDYWPQWVMDSDYSFYADVYDPDSWTHSFFWEFGDGDTATSQYTSHIFEPLTYTVAVSAQDESERVGYDAVLLACGPDTGEVTVNFVGDVMMARKYEQPGGIIPTHGVEYIFDFTLDVFGNAADVNVCNLECPLTDEGEPHPTKSIIFRSKPENVAGLTYAGIDVVSNGNNHIYDYLDRGIEETIEVLDSAGICHSGAGLDLYEALKPTFVSHEGIRIAFLGFNDRNGIQYNEQPWFYAGYSKPGCLRPTQQYMEDAINKVRDVADFIVVQIHCGEEYTSVPTFKLNPKDPFYEDIVRFPTMPDSSNTELKYMAIDLGADLVIGHHPHVLQGFEIYNGKIIAHSLGNFVFDLDYFETFPSMIVNCLLDRSGVIDCYFTPVFIDDYIPVPATGGLSKNILRRMADYSRKMGCIIVYDEEMTSAFVCVDTTELLKSPINTSGSVPVFPGAGPYYVSHPWQLSGPGDISGIDSVVADIPVPDVEVRLGKDMLWFGDFELEGATVWDLNSSDEWLDSTVFHHGQRSLVLRRNWNSSGNVITNLENRAPIEPECEHTLAGWLKTNNSADASFMVLYYQYRLSGSPLGTEYACDPVTGTQDWIFYTKDLTVPGNAGWVDIKSSNDRPAADTGYAWFDELVLIEWTDWMPADVPIDVEFPNNYTHLQMKTTTSIDSARIFCTLTSLSLQE
jgi:poly-gamma-glutamate capsule biosynthesis protein CapA/YwtB (metallophosphatase superfamily)